MKWIGFFPPQKKDKKGKKKKKTLGVHYPKHVGNSIVLKSQTPFSQSPQGGCVSWN